jgi:hypothetical protein
LGADNAFRTSRKWQKEGDKQGESCYEPHP